MEKKTINTLRTMICGELDDIAKKGIVSHENLDILKDLLESAKNLEKIEKYQSEKEEKEMGMDRGYSQRKYYIDADYDPYGPKMSYARGGRGMDNGYMDGNSYGYYEPGYRQGYGRGYSMTGSKQEMIEELKQMMMSSQDPEITEAISEVVTKIK